MLRPLPRYPLCPVCGDPETNPLTLAVRWFYNDQAHQVTGSFTGGSRHAGYEGRLHGGLLASLLDECLAWACAVARGTYFFTGELTLRYKTPAPLGETVVVSGRMATARGPYARATGEARLDHGNVLIANAFGTFAAMPRGEAEALRRAQRFSEGDLDVLMTIGGEGTSKSRSRTKAPEGE